MDYAISLRLMGNHQWTLIGQGALWTDRMATPSVTKPDDDLEEIHMKRTFNVCMSG